MRGGKKGAPFITEESEKFYGCAISQVLHALLRRGAKCRSHGNAMTETKKLLGKRV